MNIIRIARLRAMQVLADVLGFFDRGLDGAVDAFTRADRQLEVVQDKLLTKIDREVDLRVASHQRQHAVETAEFARRNASYDREDALQVQRRRAAAIQSRIGELLK